MHDIAVLDDVILAFDAHLSGGADGGLGLVMDEVFVLDDFRADEAALEVSVDDTGGLGGLIAYADGPCTALVGTGREEGLESQQAVGALDEADDAGLFQAHRTTPDSSRPISSRNI